MRNTFAILAAGTALLAAPAVAQLGGVDVDGQANVGVGTHVGVNPGDTVGTVTDRLGNTVDQVDGTVNRTVDSTNLTVVTREDVRAGAQIRDSSGTSVGTVQSVEGDTAVVVRGGKLYNVPLSAIYRDATKVTSGLVTKLSRADIKARAEAGAGAQVD